MHAHLSGYVPQNHVPVLEPDAKRRVGQVLDDLALHLDDVVLAHRSACRARSSDPVSPNPSAPHYTPTRFAPDFFNRLSYWCDITYACTCAMKSIVTTTMMSSEVPPK